MRLLHTEFILIFNEFLKRYQFNKKVFKLISYKNSLFVDKYYISRHDYSVICFLIFAIKQEYFLLSFFSNYSSFVLKDYKVFYFLEFFFYYNVFILKQWSFFNSINIAQLYLYEFLTLRVPVLIFFLLGDYIEFIKLFIYNEYISYYKELSNFSEIRAFFKKPLVKRAELQISYRKGLLKNSFIFYNYNRKVDDVKLPFYYNKVCFFSNCIFNKYLKYLLLYNLRFLFYFLVFFNKCLRFYATELTYRYSLKYPSFFFSLLKTKTTSVIKLYKFFFLVKMDFPYYVTFDLLTVILRGLKYKFFLSNTQLFFDIRSYQFSSWIDLTLIRYISRLFYFYLGYLELTAEGDVDLGYLTLLEVLVNLMHFDFSVIPLLENEVDFNIYLKLFKFNMEICIWQIYQVHLLNQNQIFVRENSMLKGFSEVQQLYVVGSLLFYEILLFYYSKYLLKNYILMKFTFIFNFLNDFSTKLLLMTVLNMADVRYLYSANLKQYKFFLFNCMFGQYFNKLYFFYKENYIMYYLETWEEAMFLTSYFLDDLDCMFYILFLYFNFCYYYVLPCLKFLDKELF